MYKSLTLQLALELVLTFLGFVMIFKSYCSTKSFNIIKGGDIEKDINIWPESIFTEQYQMAGRKSRTMKAQKTKTE